MEVLERQNQSESGQIFEASELGKQNISFQ